MAATSTPSLRSHAESVENTSLWRDISLSTIIAGAGIALLGTLSGGLAGAFEKSEQRDAAIVTFLLTGSGITLLGIGGAFWGLVAGLAVLKITTAKAAS